MKYLTKDWYELCQRTGLHYGMKINKGALNYDEDLYLNLYKRKEKEFVQIQHEVYDVDPRFMLEMEGSTLIPLHKFANDEEITEDKKMVYHMSTEERESIQEKIDECDMRPPFNEVRCKEDFRDMQKTYKIREAKEKLPHELIQQIADIRVFALGYCTKEVLIQLKKISEENERKTNLIAEECAKAQKTENIPQNLKESFGFHDCEVTELTVDKNIVMRFDTRGGFTNLNKITFIKPEVIKQEDNIVGSTWIYNELYRTENGYEAHMLFQGEEIPELIIRCKDIVIEEVDSGQY